MIELGANNLTDKNTKLICSALNVCEEWLRNVMGNIFNESPYIKELCAICNTLTPETQSSLLKIAREPRRIDERLSDNVA